MAPPGSGDNPLLIKIQLPVKGIDNKLSRQPKG